MRSYPPGFFHFRGGFRRHSTGIPCALLSANRWAGRALRLGNRSVRSIVARGDSSIEDLLEGQGFCSIHLDVIAWEDDGESVALVLEMNLQGYGRTLGEAFEDLQSAVLAQLAFAYFKGNPDLIGRPSDPIWRTRFEETREKHLKRWLWVSRCPLDPSVSHVCTCRLGRRCWKSRTMYQIRNEAQ